MNKENTRVLGIGERVDWGDVIEFDGDLITVDSRAVGEIISGDELFDVLRPLVSDPFGALCVECEIRTEMGKAALRLAIENARTLDRKQQDYGSGNIAAFGEYGILVRTWDKVSRLKNLLTNVQQPKNESVEDSWLDLSNYSLIAVLVRRGLWK